jgi:hypothetical protein
MSYHISQGEMFHANQSIYLEFGTIGRRDFVVAGSNRCLLGKRRRK